MNNDDPIERQDRTATNARLALAAVIALLLSGLLIGLLTDTTPLSEMFERGWFLATILAIVAALAGLLFDMARPKNVAWRLLRQRFAVEFGESLIRKNFGTGRGQVDEFTYFGIRCFGSPDGLEIGRIMSFLNQSLQLPWSAMSKIDTFPNLLTGRKGFETDMQARIILRDFPEMTIEVPWLAEYRQLLPKSVKYRAIKLSKK